MAKTVGRGSAAAAAAVATAVTARPACSTHPARRHRRRPARPSCRTLLLFPSGSPWPLSVRIASRPPGQPARRTPQSHAREGPAAGVGGRSDGGGGDQRCERCNGGTSGGGQGTCTVFWRKRSAAVWRLPGQAGLSVRGVSCPPQRGAQAARRLRRRRSPSAAACRAAAG